MLAQSASCMQCSEWHQRCFPRSCPSCRLVQDGQGSHQPHQHWKESNCHLVPQKPSLSCAAGWGHSGTRAWQQGHCGLLQLLPAQQGCEEGLSLFTQGVSNTNNLHALKKTFQPPCTSAPVEAMFAKAVLCLCKLSFSLASSS